MSKQVTVIVEGREYVVEVGDLTERPIRAAVHSKSFQVQVPAQTDKPVAPVTPQTAPVTPAKASAPIEQAISGSAITAPLPGDILEVKVKPGDAVNPGEVVCVLEAMKMRNMIRTPRSGVIATVEVVVGQAVDYGATLISFD